MEQARDLHGDDGSGYPCSSKNGKISVHIHLLAKVEVNLENELFTVIQMNACSSLKYLSWWKNSSATRDLSFLRVIASAMKSLDFGSAGPENDNGSMVDIVTPERASLDLSYVQTLLFCA